MLWDYRAQCGLIRLHFYLSAPHNILWLRCFDHNYQDTSCNYKKDTSYNGLQLVLNV